MRVTVISPERAVFDGQAEAVTAPAFDGEIGILPNHAPILSTALRGSQIAFHHVVPRLPRFVVPRLRGLPWQIPALS